MFRVSTPPQFQTRFVVLMIMPEIGAEEKREKRPRELCADRLENLVEKLCISCQRIVEKNGAARLLARYCNTTQTNC